MSKPRPLSASCLVRFALEFLLANLDTETMEAMLPHRKRIHWSEVLAAREKVREILASDLSCIQSSFIYPDVELLEE